MLRASELGSLVCTQIRYLVLASYPLAPSAYLCFSVTSDDITRSGKAKGKQKMNEYQGDTLVNVGFIQQVYGLNRVGDV